MAIISDDVKRGINQLRELEDRFLNESVDPRSARGPLQDIIEGKFTLGPTPIRSYGLPDWYVSPQQQLEHLRQLNTERRWGFVESDFPTHINVGDSIPRTSSEVLMLAVTLPQTRQRNKGRVQHNLEELWACALASLGFEKIGLSTLNSNYGDLELVPGSDHQIGIRWVYFDPKANRGKSVKQCWQEQLRSDTSGNTRLAASEVLMATILFPSWVASWNVQWASCLMAGYRFTEIVGHGQKLSVGIFSTRWAHQLALYSRPAHEVIEGSSLPTVRDV